MELDYRLFSSLPELSQHRVWAEIDLAALRRNYRALQEMIQKKSSATRIIAIVKAEAYGHGIPACVESFLEEGCDFFAVASLEEAMLVRKICDKKEKNASILILGYTHPAYAEKLAALHLTQALLSYDYALALHQEAKASRVVVSTHIAVDTGMNRIGFDCQSRSQIEKTAAEIAELSAFSGLSVEGMFTHFSRADDYLTPNGAAFTALQTKRYTELRSCLEAKGIRIAFHHACNSAAAVFGTEELMDGVRMGILLYGACPEIQNGISLTPVMKLKTIISHLHLLPANQPLGYGGSFCKESDRLIATLPIGYADGFLRGYEGASVCIEHNGRSYTAPVVGRICMDQCMIDVTDLPIRVGDEVVFFGNSPSELSALAASANTIDYEALCLISARVVRKYIHSQPNTEPIQKEVKS